MLIYLIRHGETAYNAEMRYQGRSDIPLSENGRAKLRPADFSPDRVYVSPLSRARETAEILFPGAVLVPVPDLQEMDFGAIEGRTYFEMAEDAAFQKWLQDGRTGRCPGSEEDRASFSERTCAAFVELLEAALTAGEEKLVIVAHGGTQMAILSRYGQPTQDYFSWQSGNGAGYILSADHWREEKVLDLAGKFSTGGMQ